MMLPTPHELLVAAATIDTDAYGAEVLTYPDAPTAMPAFVQPDDTTETPGGTVTTDLIAYTPAPVPLTARVTYAGAVYEVRRTRRWAVGSHAHYETSLKRVEG